MPMFVRLRLAEMLKEKGMTQADLGRLTGLSEERLSKLVRNLWSQLKRAEIGVLLPALDATPADLFKAYTPSIFFGSRWEGPLTVHLSARSTGNGRAYGRDPSGDPLEFNDRDVEAYKLIHDHASHLGIHVELGLHGRDSLDRLRYQHLVEIGTHIVIGSNRTGQLSEYAVAQMYAAHAFDGSALDRFPFNFSWGDGINVQSSFGFDSRSRDLEEGIYSTREKKLVAKHTHPRGGLGEDCGLIAVYRVESPADEKMYGIRKERCVVVVAGHGRVGTLGCAKLLVDPAYEEQLYPKTAKQPRMFVVQVKYFRPQPSTNPTTHDVSTLEEVRIVAEA